MTERPLPFSSPEVIEPELITIPAGPFRMGTSGEQIARLAKADEEARLWQMKGRFGREQPYHQVTLSAYRIAKYPVTVGEYRLFRAAGGYQEPAYWTSAGWAWRSAQERTAPDHWHDEQWVGDARLPVVGVSWYEAYAYCRWLSAATGRIYRLPAEAEWEKAARCRDGRLYPWGDSFDAARCNTRAGGLGRTVPVKRFSLVGASAYGCVQMVGNVSEWVQSKFRPYPYAHDGSREDPEGEDLRATRGGSWFSPTIRARCASRGMNDPFFSDHDLGFRCAGAPDP